MAFDLLLPALMQALMHLAGEPPKTCSRSRPDPGQPSGCREAADVQPLIRGPSLVMAVDFAQC
ncbi:hypothetical protein [Rubrivivax gelatinosus]|uniref:hypothetical protein n=1 Tax=Rubrivivax gelatinosus TaxID=28068 RepID=UPI0005C261E3|nr:hypothetical protein [Rubrivivax gelatinosus]MBG6082822.1 hypothetical protein [Rubrivivax gelatinosus]